MVSKMNDIKIPATRYHKAVNIVCLSLLLVTFVFLVINWQTIPEKIPGHFNASGLIDRWGSKLELWIIYLMGLLLFGGISVVEHFPKMWNTGVEITKTNQTRVYRLIKEMLVTIKLLITIMFMFLTVYPTLMINLPSWVLPLFLAGLFGVIIVQGIRVFKAR